MGTKRYGTATWNSRLGQVAATAPQAMQLVVEKTARDIEAGAKVRSRVDTGAMQSGLQAQREDAYTWLVVGLVWYTIFHEYGTAHMSARPMLTPSAEEARPMFLAALAAAWR